MFNQTRLPLTTATRVVAGIITSAAALNSSKKPTKCQNYMENADTNYMGNAHTAGRLYEAEQRLNAVKTTFRATAWTSYTKLPQLKSLNGSKSGLKNTIEKIISPYSDELKNAKIIDITRKISFLLLRAQKSPGLQEKIKEFNDKTATPKTVAESTKLESALIQILHDHISQQI
jgi:hypothetical protein